MLGNMQQQTKRTTIGLDPELYRAWKATGLPLSELIRRGIEGTGDNARHVAAETRLAFMEARLSVLESRAASQAAAMYPASVAEVDDLDDGDVSEPAMAQFQIEQARRRHEHLVRWHDQLWAKLRRDPERAAVVTVADLLDLTGANHSSVRTMMHKMVAAEYAIQHPRREGTGDPYKWTIRDPATVDRSAPNPSPGTEQAPADHES